MIVAADGEDMENETVPFHCTASFLFPVGYAEEYGIKLVPPGGDEGSCSSLFIVSRFPLVSTFSGLAFLRVIV